MTRRMVVVNLSNHKNEDFVITQGEDVKRIAPGESTGLDVYPVEEKTITVEPVNNPEAPAEYTDPAAKRIDLRAVKPQGHSGNRMIRWFDREHLEADLAEIEDCCVVLAEEMDERLAEGPEKTTGLRKLLEARECFVRAQIEGNSAG